MTNHISEVGNLTRDPELKFLNNGGTSVRIGLAVNRRWQNRQTQEWEERTSFFTVVGYGALAENAANSLKQGDRVVVIGRLEQRDWTTEAGEKKSVIEIIADEIAPSLAYASTVVSKNAKPEGRSTGNARPRYDAPEEAF